MVIQIRNISDVLDQVEGEDLVDKIAALGFWPFFTSYLNPGQQKVSGGIAYMGS